MLELFSTAKTIGLELNLTSIKCAEVTEKFGQLNISNLFTLPLNHEHVKRLYIKQPILATGLDGMQVLLRPLTIPLVKNKDIEAALPFQTEPLLPYPIDQALLSSQIVKKDSEETKLLVLTTKKESLQKHLEECASFEIIPEKVSCTQAALSQFSQYFLPKNQTFLIIHFSENIVTSLLISDGLMISSFAQKEVLPDLQNENEPSIEQLKKIISKISFSFAKESRQVLSGVIFTGEVAKWPSICEQFSQHIQLPIISLENQTDKFSHQEILVYAVPIGLALGSHYSASPKIDFRQEEYLYPYPWKRLKFPLALYFGLMFSISALFYFFGYSYLSYKETLVKQEYVDTLAGMNKSYEQFESSYLTKNQIAREKSQGEVVEINQLNLQDLLDRLTFLQKDLQATPDSFPLFANIPKVSDVLAWLSSHDTVSFLNEKGEREHHLQIESFNYVLVKRPMQGKKQEKYQVKVELEFSSATPKWAREFHDALITANDWVDPKGEVKWSSNRGRYKTSFFLKDKTIYPSQ
jgi:type IV pilus assembly protein PilM